MRCFDQLPGYRGRFVRLEGSLFLVILVVIIDELVLRGAR
jgi:hypothetical protein